MISLKKYKSSPEISPEITSGTRHFRKTSASGESVSHSEVRHPSFLLLSTFAVICVLIQCNCVEGHIASFISSEGKPSLTPRPIRGPTVPKSPFPPSSTEILRLPGFTFLRGGSGGERKLYLRNMNDGFVDVNSGIVTSGRNSQAAEDKPTFVPYIGPRALSSVNEYLRHLRENLEALHSNEDVDDGDYVDDSDYAGVGEIQSFSHQSNQDKQHSRRHVNPNPSEQNSDLSWDSQLPPQLLPLSDNSHTPNRRQFVEPETFLIRRSPLPSQYSPSWSYTKLGLGKRKRGERRIRPWQQ